MRQNAEPVQKSLNTGKIEGAAADYRGVLIDSGHQRAREEDSAMLPAVAPESPHKVSQDRLSNNTNSL